MTTAVSQSYEINAVSATCRRATALAERLEQGARALVDLATALTDTEWQTRIPGDGRKIGVVVHHVATMYPLEVQLAQTLAQGKPIEGVTWDVVHEINARHAAENDTVTKQAALDLLRCNSAAAATAITAFGWVWSTCAAGTNACSGVSIEPGRGFSPYTACG